MYGLIVDTKCSSRYMALVAITSLDFDARGPSHQECCALPATPPRQQKAQRNTHAFTRKFALSAE